jgi:hypothetical protein
MHFCTAYIAIAGDDQQIMYRGPFDPVSWPEIEVLRVIHGDLAVRDVHPFVRVEQDARAEQERLALIYGDVVTKEVYRGRKPSMDLDAAEMDILADGQAWLNPLTKQIEALEQLEPEPKPDGRSKAARAKLSEAAKTRPRDEKGRLLPADAEDDRGSIEEVI